MSSRHVRIYRTLLRLYPRTFRAEYRDEMTRLFADQLRDARATDGRVGVVRLWGRAVVDLIKTGPGEHLEEGEQVLAARPIGSPSRPTSLRDRGSPGVWVVVALFPLWLLMILGVLAPWFIEPLYDEEINIMGVPAGLFLIGCAFIWMAIGVAAMASRSSNRRRSLALLLFAGSATTIVMLAPALVVILKNLGT